MKINGIAFILICFILVANGCASDSSLQSSSNNLSGSIVYAQNSTGTSEIYKIQADGSSDTKVNGIPEKAYGPVVSPDGKRIAFYVHVSDYQWSLYMLNLENSEVKQLTDEMNFYDWAISWAPDSQWFYFTRSQMNEAWESEIWKINVEDSSQTRVIKNQAQGGALSPDGQSLLYFDYSEGGGDIWLYDLNEKTSVQLTTTVGEDWWPSWSPDGKNIVYQGKRKGNFELFSMDLESKQVTQLTASEGDEEEPQLSPDGTGAIRLTKLGVRAINPSWCK